MYTDPFVHLTYSDGKINDRVACIDVPTEYRMYGVVKHHPNYSLSGDPRAVTCPGCKKSPVFARMLAQLPR